MIISKNTISRVTKITISILFSVDIDETNMMDFIKRINLNDFRYILFKAWNSVGQLSLKNTRHKLLMKTYETHYNKIIEAILEIISAFVINLKICNECDVFDIEQRLESGISNFIRQ